MKQVIAVDELTNYLRYGVEDPERGFRGSMIEEDEIS